MNSISNNAPVNSASNNTDLGPAGSIQMMFAKLQLAQASMCKEKATEYMKEIEGIQAEQKATAEMIAKARELQNQAKNNGSSTMPEEMKKFFKDRGLSWETTGNDDIHNKDEWEYNIKSLTNHQDQVGTKTQTLMVYLQDFIGQYNSFTQGANSAISDANDTLKNILR